jgi:hypothetical protein
VCMFVHLGVCVLACVCACVCVRVCVLIEFNISFPVRRTHRENIKTVQSVTL